MKSILDFDDLFSTQENSLFVNLRIDNRILKDSLGVFGFDSIDL